jgi:hypothetical protein
MHEIPDVRCAVLIYVATDQHLSGSTSVLSPASQDAAENLTILISTRFLQFLSVLTALFFDQHYVCMSCLLFVRYVCSPTSPVSNFML